LRPLRRPPRPCLSRRASTHGRAPLPELGLARLHADGPAPARPARSGRTGGTAGRLTPRPGAAGHRPAWDNGGMAGRIPSAFIDELLARVDIVDVVGARVPLTKAGRDLQARCPFHDERTPSFTVSPGKQFYHCFGCGAHGSAIRFLMEYDRLDFTDAVEELARLVGLSVPYEGGAARQEDHRDDYALLAEVAGWFEAQLRASAAARD